MWCVQDEQVRAALTPCVASIAVAADAAPALLRRRLLAVLQQAGLHEQAPVNVLDECAPAASHLG